MNFGEGESVIVVGLALGNEGFLYLSGHTGGMLEETYFGGWDAFVAKLAIAVIPEPPAAVMAVSVLICGLIDRGPRPR
jgi:hypothetical protein